MQTQKQYLPNLFKQLWKQKTNNDWKDGISGMDFDKYLKTNFFKNLTDKKQINNLSPCLIKNWDINFITRVVLDIEKKSDISKAVQIINQQRNHHAHQKTNQTPDYENMFKNLNEALILIGVQQLELKIFLEQLSKNNQTQTVQISDLIIEAQQYFKCDQILQAIEYLNDQIELQNINNNTELSKLHLERSKYYLLIYLEDRQQEKLDQSNFDAFTSEFHDPYNNETQLQKFLIQNAQDSNQKINSNPIFKETKYKDQKCIQLIETYLLKNKKILEDLKYIYQYLISIENEQDQDQEEEFVLKDIKINTLFLQINELLLKKINEYIQKIFNISSISGLKISQLSNIINQKIFKQRELNDIRNNNMDTSLLCKMILNGFQNFEIEQQSIKKIKDIRNEFFHKTEYNSNNYDLMIQDLLEILKKIEYDQDIESQMNSDISTLLLKNKNTVIQQSNKEYEELKSKANTMFQNQDYDQAIDLYKNALKLKIDIKQKSIIYHNRSLCYLKKLKAQHISQQDLDKELSINDAHQSILYDPFYTKPRYILSQIYFMNKQFKQALYQINFALKLDPQNPIFLGYKQQIVSITKKSELTVYNSQKEYQAFYEKDSITSFMLNNQVLRNQIIDDLDKRIPGSKDFQLGLQYRLGNGVKQSNDLAAFYYRKSIEKNLSNGYLSLYNLLDDGLVEPLYPKEGLDCIIKATDDSVEDEEVRYLSRQAMGLQYKIGQFVQKNFRLSIYWFQLGSDSGSAQSSYNLAFHLLQQEQQFDSHIQLQELFKQRKISIECIKLLLLSIYQGVGNAKSIILQLLNMKDLYIDKNDMKIFDENQDYTFNFQNEELNHMFDQQSYFELKLNKFKMPYLHLQENNKIDQIMLRNFKDKYYAKVLLQSLNYYDEIINIIKDNQQNNVKDEELIKKSINLLRNNDSIMGYFSYYQLKYIKKIVQNFIQLDQVNQLDQDARILQIYFQQDFKSKDTIDFIEKCMQIYPKEKFYYLAKALYYYEAKQYQKAIESYDLVIQLDSKNIEAHFLKSQLLYHQNNFQESEKCIKQILIYIPPSDPLLPEIYYNLGLCMKHQIKENKQNFVQISGCYNQGIQSEKQLLPMYKPYQSEFKQQLKKYLIDQQIPIYQNIYIDSYRKKLTQYIRERFQLKKDQINLKQQTNIESNDFIDTKSKLPSNYIPHNIITFCLQDDLKLRECYIDVVVIDFPVIDYFTKHLILLVQDWSQYIRVKVKYQDIQDSVYKFRIGCKLRIKNPYFQQKDEDDQLPNLLVLKSEEMLVMGYEPIKCVVCFRLNPQISCLKCNAFYYCNNECKQIDEQDLNHQQVCNQFKKCDLTLKFKSQGFKEQQN